MFTTSYNWFGIFFSQENDLGIPAKVFFDHAQQGKRKHRITDGVCPTDDYFFHFDFPRQKLCDKRLFVC
jgi:hypothetical protein